MNIDVGQSTSMGDLLAGIMKSDLFADLLAVSEAASPEAARAAVDSRQAATAVIIPADFTSALTEPGTTGSGVQVEVYRDPTLTLGPMVVDTIVRQLVDRFAAGTIGTGVTLEQASSVGIPITPDLVQEVVSQHTAAAFAPQDQAALITVQEPAGVNTGENFLSQLLGLFLGGMMVFFAFFTGSASIQSILVEEEKGTLQRLFTTPVPRRTILGGKGMGAVLMLVVQITVLMTFGVLVFRVDWGQPLTVTLAAAGLVLVATATGLFLVSFLRNTRQGGVVFGGILTLTGTLGMMPIYTGGIASSRLIEVASLLVPQGWAIRGFVIAADGGTVADLMPTLLVTLSWTAVFAAIGLRRLQQRFA